MSTSMGTDIHGQHSLAQAHRVSAIKARITRIRIRTAQVESEIERAQTERGRRWLRSRPNWMRLLTRLSRMAWIQPSGFRPS